MIVLPVQDTFVVAEPVCDRADGNILGVILALRFLVNSGRICGRGATLQCRKFLFSPSNFTKSHLTKIERFVTNVTAVCPPDRHYNSKHLKNGLSEICDTGSENAPCFTIFYRWRSLRFVGVFSQLLTSLRAKVTKTMI